MLWREVIRHPGASYVAVHFATCILGPLDYVRVTSPEPGVVLHRAVYNTRTNPAPEAGNYTVVFGPAGPAAGSGYGVVKVDGAGRVKLSGSLADGQSALLGPEGVGLYGGAGSLQGQMVIKAGREAEGQLTWIKPPLATSKYYPAGFHIETQARGCAFAGAVFDGKVLPIVNGELRLSEGDPPETLSALFTLGPGNKVAQAGSTRFNISFSRSTGLMTGRVFEVFSGKWQSFKGVVLE